MNFNELTEKRYSVRFFQSCGIEDDKLQKVLEAARVAPSAVNRQPWHFYVVKSAEGRAAVLSSYPREWFAAAPVYMVVTVEPSSAWTRPFDGKNHADIDGAIATEHICLAAADQGLGSCWVCNFDPEVLKSALRLPQGSEPMAIVPLGYPSSDERRPFSRRPLSEIATEI